MLSQPWFVVRLQESQTTEWPSRTMFNSRLKGLVVVFPHDPQESPIR
ncbi:MAG: hypothetical protein JXB36_01940 [Gammaproteobacteria bacterium]|nr:hypothetical protein [Gammaproteobacteria bacterium]